MAGPVHSYNLVFTYPCQPPPPPPTFLSLAHAQASPTAAIDLSSTSVEEGTAITVSMSFSNLAEDSDRATTDYLFRADVLDADGCEEQAGGYGLGVDRKINLVDEDPEVRRGTISADCPAGDYTVRASISDADGGELASATAGFSVAAPEPPASSDAALSGLALSGVTLDFDPATATYAADVGNDLAETTVTPTVNDDGATYAVRLDGAADEDGTIPLAVGENTITIEVTAEDGETNRIYTVTVTRAEAPPEPPASSDAALSGLALSGVTLDFDPATTTYAVEVGNDLAETTVSPTVNDDGATYVVRLDGAADEDGTIPLAVGENTITIEVTAEDGETIRTYTVTVTRAAPDPTVSIVLSPSDGVEEGDEIAVTMSFGNLTFDDDRVTTDYIFRADVKDSENGDADGCEDQAGGYGLGVDRYMYQVDEDPETRNATISADCPAGVYTVEASISNADNEELASASAGFSVLPLYTAVVVEEPEEEEPRVARQTDGSTMTVVVTQPSNDNFTLAISWVDGGACASGTNYYAYLRGVHTLLGTFNYDLGNVASTANTMTRTHTDPGTFNDLFHNFRTTTTVYLYCGARASGRLVAEINMGADVDEGTYYYPAPSSALSGLTVGGVPVPGFVADTTEYSMMVDNSVERATVAATVEAASSTYAVTAPADADVDTDGHQVDLAVGDSNVITVVVTAVDDTTTTYTVTVTRRAPTAMTVVWTTSDDDRTLALTWTDGGTCASGTNYYGYAFAKIGSDERYFDIDNVASTAQTLTGTLTSHYFADTLPPGSTTEAHLYCGARGASGSRLVAKVEITGLNSGTFRTPTPALSALSLTGVTAAALGFEKDTLDYSVTVGNAVTSTTVAAAVDREGDTFVVNLGGAEDDDQVIPLSPGDNVITVVVSAEDGSVSTTYTVTVKREGPPVTIGAGVPEATEGDVLTFTLRRAGSMVGAVPVKFEVSETGDMVSSSNEGMRTETIPDGSDILTFQVATVRFDQVWEAHSTVTVTLQADDAYMVTGDPATMLVRDDDFPDATVTMALSSNTGGRGRRDGGRHAHRHHGPGRNAPRPAHLQHRGVHPPPRRRARRKGPATTRRAVGKGQL